MPAAKLTNILFNQWQQTLQYFEVDQLKVESTFAQLVEAYSTTGRYYHTLQHIHYVLNKIQTLQANTPNLPAVQLAAWFHDAIYDTRALDNEEKSAEYACKLMNNLEIPISYITTVNRLILNTKYHKATADDIDSHILLDADLAILAADSVDYQEYANAIRQEYAWVPETDYVMGRKQVLEKFLQRQYIYFTPLMFEVAEQSARANLQAEIQRLSQGRNT
ncbi:hypothetical protein I8751_27525 [Nostocaceae cyanobacterium CENA357]|uniref:Metal-dependent HD superfamily phosphohydrolase n=1 Tax=Atlanticothrix silvestris CENA357 TaxID=1725252 RepID=A0A8J7HN52_9CYAN|nr:hypothetical protein [Atlanticothrix silvestris]MBH8556026.1 hypothetical protein [Atlanticothrix silvestris CENA357]